MRAFCCRTSARAGRFRDCGNRRSAARAAPREAQALEVRAHEERELGGGVCGCVGAADRQNFSPATAVGPMTTNASRSDRRRAAGDRARPAARRASRQRSAFADPQSRCVPEIPRSAAILGVQTAQVHWSTAEVDHFRAVAGSDAPQARHCAQDRASAPRATVNAGTRLSRKCIQTLSCDGASVRCGQNRVLLMLLRPLPGLT